jgi:hypothetical protein
MKKNNVKWIFNDHSTERFFERTELNATKKQIAKAITNNQLIPFNRVNATRSMTYIHVNKQVIKTVMHRKKNKIITVLPWNSIFHYIIEVQIHKYNKRYRINLYPDCYLETKTPDALTKIFEFQGVDDYWNQAIWGKIRYSHPLFNEIFGIAWTFLQADEDHCNIQNERKNGNETFEISGKAKEIKTLAHFGVDYAAPKI